MFFKKPYIVVCGREGQQMRYRVVGARSKTKAVAAFYSAKCNEYYTIHGVFSIEEFSSFGAFVNRREKDR